MPIAIFESEVKCDLCKKSLFLIDERRIGKWKFHLDCYQTVTKRLENFMQIVTLTQKEFNEWLDDDN